MVGKANVKHLKFGEAMEAFHFLKEVCTSSMEGDRKIATYKSPWTDDLVTKELRKTIPSMGDFTISKMRQEYFGHLRPRREGRSSQGAAALHTRITALSERLNKLTDWAKSMDPGTNFD